MNLAPTLARRGLSIVVSCALAFQLGCPMSWAADAPAATPTEETATDSKEGAVEDKAAKPGDEPRDRRAVSGQLPAVRDQRKGTGTDVERARPSVTGRTRVTVDDPAAAPEPAPSRSSAVRVETDDAPDRADRSADIAVHGGTARRAFRVVDIRGPDVGIWFDPAATDSLVVADIAPSGPIAQLGLQEGDRILEVNHVKVTRETDFIKLLFATKARDHRVEVLIVRKNREQVIVVEPALLIDEYMVVRHDPLEQLGLVVDDRYDDRVVVWKVIPRSPAFYGGIRPGDVITRFGDQRVVERKSFADLIGTVQPGRLAIEVDRARRVRPIQIDVPRDWNVEYSNERREARTEESNERTDLPSRAEQENSAEVGVEIDGSVDTKNGARARGRTKLQPPPPRGLPSQRK